MNRRHPGQRTLSSFEGDQLHLTALTENIYLSVAAKEAGSVTAKKVKTRVASNCDCWQPPPTTAIQRWLCRLCVNIELVRGFSGTAWNPSHTNTVGISNFVMGKDNCGLASRAHIYLLVDCIILFVTRNHFLFFHL